MGRLDQRGTCSAGMSFEDSGSYQRVPQDNHDRNRTPSEADAQALQAQLQVPAHELQARNNNLLTIERDVVEVAEVAADLPLMVDADSKTKVAAIGQHIDQTTDNTQAANTNLRKAITGRNWKQTFCCALLALLSIFNTICIIIIIKRESDKK